VPRGARAAAQATPEQQRGLLCQLARQAETIAAGDHVGFFTLDEAMHRELLRIAGHPMVWELIVSAKAQLDRVRYLSLEDGNWLAMIFRQHQDIADRIAAGDAEGAEQAMQAHLRTVFGAIDRIAATHAAFFEHATVFNRNRRARNGTDLALVRSRRCRGAAEIRQAGATGIVTALYHIPYGVVWSTDEIARRKGIIEADPNLGLRWSVVESLPVAEPIKLGEGEPGPLFENYRISLRNLAALGVTTVCYNFMPVLDWTRTQLAAPLPGGGTALRFNAHEYAAFDCFILQRQGAEAEQSPDVLRRAHAWLQSASESDRDRLLNNIMAGLPGAYDRYDVPGLRRMLDRYGDIDHATLRANLACFCAPCTGGGGSRGSPVHPSR